MSHRTQLALVLAAALLSGGCGTINNVNKPCIAPENRPDASVCRVYGGLREDWHVFWHYPWKQTTAYCDYVCIPLLAVGTFCFDIVGDTLTLPYTTYEEIRRAVHRPDSSSGYVTVAVPDAIPVAPPGAVPLPAPRPAPAPGGAPVVPALPPIPQAPAVTSPR